MELKKRIIALDIGTKRIGVAVCDALWMGATPVKLILRKKDNTAIEEIKKYVKNTIQIQF